MKLPSHRLQPERLKEAMRRRGIRKARLAGEIGVWPSQIKRWLDEDSTPAGDNLTKLCKALGVTPAYLFGDTEDADEKTKALDMVMTVFGRTEADLIAAVQALTPHHKTVLVANVRGWLKALKDYETGQLPITPFEREQASPTAALPAAELAAADEDELSDDDGETGTGTAPPAQPATQPTPRRR